MVYDISTKYLRVYSCRCIPFLLIFGMFHSRYDLWDTWIFGRLHFCLAYLWVFRTLKDAHELGL
jgi:hypothetical protein